MSLNEAPTPVTKPYQRPLFSVRCTQSTPTGPIGADAIIPISIPLNMKFSMSICIGKGITNAKLRRNCGLHKFLPIIIAAPARAGSPGNALRSGLFRRQKRLFATAWRPAGSANRPLAGHKQAACGLQTGGLRIANARSAGSKRQGCCATTAGPYPKSGAAPAQTAKFLETNAWDYRINHLTLQVLPLNLNT